MNSLSVIAQRIMSGLALVFLICISAKAQDRTTVLDMPKEVPKHWPIYHLLHPEHAAFWPADPNGAFYYKGRYHLHYLYPSEEGGLGMVHVSSKDMVHWKFHPIVLRPDTLGHQMLSGTGFFTKE